MMWPPPPPALRAEGRGKRYYGEGRRGAGMGGAGKARMVGCGAEGIAEARRIVAGGGLIAFPTDTVYAIGCDPFDGRAVGLVYEAKGRPPSKPLPVLGASAAGLSSIAALEGRAARLAARFWPGPLTIVARASPPPPPPGRPLAPQLASGGGGIAVRVPAGRCVSGLLAACGPLVGTSANLSGRPPCRTAAECAEQLGDRVPLVVDGGKEAAAAGAGGGGVSTVVEVGGGDGGLRIVREGLVGRGDLERIL